VHQISGFLLSEAGICTSVWEQIASKIAKERKERKTKRIERELGKLSEQFAG